jgi:hypothetical protein
MKKVILSFLVLCTLSGPLMAYPSHPPQVTSPVQMLYRLKESQQLLNQVEAAGPITIEWATLGTVNAMWVPEQRIIYLDMSKRRTPGNVTISILFELHNALNQSKFDYYDQMVRQGTISRKDYITAVEQIEYNNALQTMRILEKGVQRGIFPPDAHWPIAPTFQEHYRVQIESGHSQLIGYVYDNLRHDHQAKMARVK